jgi:UDP-glucuronate decarboxylase
MDYWLKQLEKNMDYNHQEELNEIDNRLKTANISFKGKHVLITGGAGFLGSWVCELLLKQGAKVLCLDNLSSGLWENISHLIDNPSFKFINHDISVAVYFGKYVPNEVSYPTITDRIDIVMHLASRASPFEFKLFPISILKSNTLGTMNALGIAKEHNSVFFYSSTSEVYGNPPPEAVPTSEEYFGHVNPVGPRSCYDEAKRAGEAFIKAYELQHNINVHFIRIFNTYGPRIRAGKEFGRVIPNFITQCLNDEPITVFGDGSQTRSFTFVDDLIEGMMKDIHYPEARGIPINVGNNVMNSVLELAETIKRLTKSNSKIIFKDLPIDDPLLRQPILTRANKILDWKPTTDLETGLKKTIAWFEKMVDSKK